MNKHEFMQNFRNSSKAFKTISEATSVLLTWDMEGSKDPISLIDMLELYQALKDIQTFINRACIDFSCESEFTFELGERKV